MALIKNTVTPSTVTATYHLINTVTWNAAEQTAIIQINSYVSSVAFLAGAAPLGVTQQIMPAPSCPAAADVYAALVASGTFVNAQDDSLGK